MFRFLFALCFVGVSYCQTACQQCVNNTLQQQKAAWQQKEAAKKAAEKACYDSAGCQQPTFNHSGHGNFSNGNFEATKTCIQQVKSNVESCVQQNGFPTFHMPTFEHHEGEHRGFSGDHHGFGRSKRHEGFGGQREGHYGGWGRQGRTQWLSKACGNDTNKTATLEQCLHNLHNGSHGNGHEGHKLFRHDPREKFCNVSSTCSNQTGQDCLAEFKNIRKALCNCTKQYKSQFEACFNHTGVSNTSSGRKRRAAHANHGGPKRGEGYQHGPQHEMNGGYEGRPHGKFGMAHDRHGMMMDFCNEKDICSGNTQQHQMHQSDGAHNNFGNHHH